MEHSFPGVSDIVVDCVANDVPQDHHHKYKQGIKNTQRRQKSADDRYDRAFNDGQRDDYQVFICEQQFNHVFSIANLICYYSL